MALMLMTHHVMFMKLALLIRIYLQIKCYHIAESQTDAHHSHLSLVVDFGSC